MDVDDLLKKSNHIIGDYAMKTRNSDERGCLLIHGLDHYEMTNAQIGTTFKDYKNVNYLLDQIQSRSSYETVVAFLDEKEKKFESVKLQVNLGKK